MSDSQQGRGFEAPRAGSGDATGAAVAAPSAVAAALEKPAVAADNAVHATPFHPGGKFPIRFFGREPRLTKPLVCGSYISNRIDVLPRRTPSGCLAQWITFQEEKNMSRGRRSLVFAPFVVASLTLIPVVMISQANAQSTGYAEHRPIVGGATRINPWGALADIVKQAVAPYGWDVQVCYNCAGGENEVIDVEDKKNGVSSHLQSYVAGVGWRTSVACRLHRATAAKWSHRFWNCITAICLVGVQRNGKQVGRHRSPPFQGLAPSCYDRFAVVFDRCSDS